MIQIFGDFVDELPTDVEYLVIGFSPNSMPLKQRWRNNGLSADFIAGYLDAFFIGDREAEASSEAPIPVQSKNAVKYVANELLENAMKFSDTNATYPTRIAFHLFRSRLVFHTLNSISGDNMKKFQGFIKELMDSDPNEFYIRQMEANASEEAGSHSGLGYLSMICDYSAKLSWKFESSDDEPPVHTVTTAVSIDV
ncbi:MAG: ATP-binding protein [Gammaproteobacteria bacterium]|nr:ATP-binding protein [Gammaproteobacteria bacterium]